jgi:hypothetical protein
MQNNLFALVSVAVVSAHTNHCKQSTKKYTGYAK